jgi:hypothetical protein
MATSIATIVLACLLISNSICKSFYTIESVKDKEIHLSLIYQFETSIQFYESVMFRCEGDLVFNIIGSSMMPLNENGIKIRIGNRSYEKCKKVSERILDGEIVDICHSSLATITPQISSS